MGLRGRSILLRCVTREHGDDSELHVGIGFGDPFLLLQANANKQLPVRGIAQSRTPNERARFAATL
jgi:hypothetical protein